MFQILLTFLSGVIHLFYKLQTEIQEKNHKQYFTNYRNIYKRNLAQVSKNLIDPKSIPGGSWNHCVTTTWGSFYLHVSTWRRFLSLCRHLIAVFTSVFEECARRGVSHASRHESQTLGQILGLSKSHSCSDSVTFPVTIKYALGFEWMAIDI